MDTRSLPRRRVLRLTGTLPVVAVPGCLGGLGGGAGEPDIDETITEPATYTFDLDAGDTIRMEFDDGEPTRYITYEIAPPEGITESQTKTSVDERWTADAAGEHRLTVEPSRETQVRIWIL